MAPVVHQLMNRDIPHKLISTGQHDELLKQALEAFQIEPAIDYDLMEENQTTLDFFRAAVDKLRAAFQTDPPRAVLAQGDTMTVTAAAMVCFYMKIPFGHVEAGLRTWDMDAPRPEEFNRRVAALATKWHFAPTITAVSNLLDEHVDEGAIHNVGNTSIDALQHILATTEWPGAVTIHTPGVVEMKDQPYVLMTCHRREAFGTPIREVFSAVADFATVHKDLRFWYPVHPNPEVKVPAYEILDGVKNVILSEPLDYVTFAHAMKHALFILTDSGGVQEEAPSLGVPVLVLRDKTERPEGVDAGTCRLVGTDYLKIAAMLDLLVEHPEERERMSKAVNPYGDGHAAERIINILEEDLYDGKKV